MVFTFHFAEAYRSRQKVHRQTTCKFYFYPFNDCLQLLLCQRFLNTFFLKTDENVVEWRQWISLTISFCVLGCVGSSCFGSECLEWARYDVCLYWSQCTSWKLSRMSGKEEKPRMYTQIFVHFHLIFLPNFPNFRLNCSHNFGNSIKIVSTKISLNQLLSVSKFREFLVK